LFFEYNILESEAQLQTIIKQYNQSTLETEFDVSRSISPDKRVFYFSNILERYRTD